MDDDAPTRGPGTASGEQAPLVQNERRERADSRRKRLRLLDAARAAVAQSGIDVAAAEIAARAEVGVGTLYRRFGTKEALIEAALRDAVDSTAEAARTAAADTDPMRGLTALLTTIVGGQVANRGVSDFAARSGNLAWSAEARGQTRVIRRSLSGLVLRAQQAGALRPDLGWRDVLVIAQAAATGGRCLGVAAAEQQWQRTLTIILDGLSHPDPAALPGRPAADEPGFDEPTD